MPLYVRVGVRKSVRLGIVIGAVGMLFVLTALFLDYVLLFGPSVDHGEQIGPVYVDEKVLRLGVQICAHVTFVLGMFSLYLGRACLAGHEVSTNDRFVRRVRLYLTVFGSLSLAIWIPLLAYYFWRAYLS